MITISQFRADKDLVKFASEVFLDRTFQLMLEACEQAHPLKKAVAADNNNDVSPTSAAIELGIQKGYQAFLDNLRLLTLPRPESEGGMLDSQYKAEVWSEPESPEQKPAKKPKRKK